MKVSNKYRLIGIIQGWIESTKGISRAHTDLVVERLQTKHNINLELELIGMTQKQLNIVLAAFSIAYNKGCNDTREHLNKLRTSSTPKE